MELLIRVDGRGLENVTRAWIDGVSPPPAAPTPGGGAAAAAAQPGGGSGQGGQVAEVSIVQQPRARLLARPADQPPLPLVGQLSSFFSWCVCCAAVNGCRPRTAAGLTS